MVKDPEESTIKRSPPGLEPHSLEPSAVLGRHRTSAQPAVTAMNECVFASWRIINIKLHTPSPY